MLGTSTRHTSTSQLGLGIALTTFHSYSSYLLTTVTAATTYVRAIMIVAMKERDLETDWGENHNPLSST